MVPSNISENSTACSVEENTHSFTFSIFPEKNAYTIEIIIKIEGEELC